MSLMAKTTAWHTMTTRIRVRMVEGDTDDIGEP